MKEPIILYWFLGVERFRLVINGERLISSPEVLSKDFLGEASWKPASGQGNSVIQGVLALAVERSLGPLDVSARLDDWKERPRALWPDFVTKTARGIEIELGILK